MNRNLRAAMGISCAVVAGIAVLASVGNPEPTVPPAAVKSGSCVADQEEMRAVPERIVDGWAANDADAVAAVFTTGTDFVIGDGTFLRGREELRRYLADGFAGFLKDTRVTAPVQSVRCLSSTVGVVHTLGGILLPGETEVPPERQGIQVFIVTKHGGEWLVNVYQNTRIKTSA
ncbi:MAG: SgcJ/EcaC family oxidoreductase [Pseudonocardiaceae bacterium]